MLSERDQDRLNAIARELREDDRRFCIAVEVGRPRSPKEYRQRWIRMLVVVVVSAAVFITAVAAWIACRSSAGTPSSSQITSAGTGVANEPTRSAGDPSFAMSSSASAVYRRIAGVSSATIARPSLDDVYLRHVGRAYRASDQEVAA